MLKSPIHLMEVIVVGVKEATPGSPSTPDPSTAVLETHFGSVMVRANDVLEYLPDTVLEKLKIGVLEEDIAGVGEGLPGSPPPPVHLRAQLVTRPKVVEKLVVPVMEMPLGALLEKLLRAVREKHLQDMLDKLQKSVLTKLGEVVVVTSLGAPMRMSPTAGLETLPEAVLKKPPKAVLRKPAGALESLEVVDVEVGEAPMASLFFVVPLSDVLEKYVGPV